MRTRKESLTTNGIRISVTPTYQATYSRPAQDRYIFAYQVVIENQGATTVQLLRRHWIIWDGDGHIREVEGEGVVGKQPVLAPGQRYEYSSWCDLNSGFGKMHGAFLMVAKEDGEAFQAGIPEFLLIAPVRLN